MLEAFDGNQFLGHDFQCHFGLFAAYVLSRYTLWGRNALIVTISLPTAIPTAVAVVELLLLLGGRMEPLVAPAAARDQTMFTYAGHNSREHICTFAGVLSDQTSV